MRPVNWLLPATVVWVATRNEELADGIADRRDIWAADEALKSPDRSRDNWKSALALLTKALRAEVIHAVGLNGVRISSAAWMAPVRTIAGGLVAGAEVQMKATKTRWWERPHVVGGVIPVFRRSEVIAAFPAGRSAAGQERNSRRVGRPTADNSLYIERAVEMLARGDPERAVRQHLKIVISDSESIGQGAALKRIAGVILPEARARVGKNSP